MVWLQTDLACALRPFLAVAMRLNHQSQAALVCCRSAEPSSWLLMGLILYRWIRPWFSVMHNKVRACPIRVCFFLPSANHKATYPCTCLYHQLMWNSLGASLGSADVYWCTIKQTKTSFGSRQSRQIYTFFLSEIFLKPNLYSQHGGCCNQYKVQEW